MRLRGKLTQIKGPLEKAFRKANLEDQMREAMCVDLWEEVVGEANAHATQADSIRDGILFVSVKSSAWAQELSFLKEEIVKKLNQRIGKNLVKDIQFKTRTLRKSPRKDQASSEPGIESIVLTDEELAELEKNVSHIKHESLRQRALKLLISQKKTDKLKLSQGWKPCPRCKSLYHGNEELCPICLRET